MRADQLIIPGAQPQTVTFVDFAAGKIVYQTRGGDRNDRELERISHIAVDGEPALNEAEDAFSRDLRDKSIDGYMKTIRSTAKPWLRGFAAKRLNTALGNSDRFDARMVAYLAMLTYNPDAAAALKPDLPPTGNKLLDLAITDIEATLKLPNLTPAQQLGLYNFLIDVHRQRKDEPALTQTLERLDRLSSTLGDIPEIKQQLAGAKINQARSALDQQKYADAMKLVNDNRQSIAEPRLQADALFILARAKQASASPGDMTALREAALHYMRIVAHFGDMEGRPNVLASLQATAAILEQVGDKTDAQALLEQISKEFPDDPAAEKARQDLARLKAAG
ncbi:MAG: hypothetical protein H7144_08135 [Burkholderiales bacterium]|nr:hypothetical protein [Phycisphaerae bacterium]